MKISTRLVCLLGALLLGTHFSYAQKAGVAASPLDLSSLKAVDAATAPTPVTPAPSLSPNQLRFKEDGPARAVDPDMYNWLPSSSVLFEPNVGQVRDFNGGPRPDVSYMTRTGGAQVFFRQTGVSYVFTRRADGGIAGMKDAPAEAFARINSEDKKKIVFEEGEPDYARNRVDPASIKMLAYEQYEHVRLDLNFLGADPGAQIMSGKKAETYFSYYLPGRTGKQTRVPASRMIVYKNLYPNIDLVFYGDGGALKYDFIVRPGADPAQIRMEYAGAESVGLGEGGALVVKHPFGELREKAPVAFQKIPQTFAAEDLPRIAGSSNTRVAFSVSGNTVSFNIPKYDNQRMLVIDPEVQWYNYFGGDAADVIRDILVGLDGNVHVCGHSSSTAGFPSGPPGNVTNPDNIAAGERDIFVIQFDENGNPNWIFYAGGSGNGQLHNEFANNLAIDNRDGSVYVTGITNQDNFPVTTGPPHRGETDAFLVKLDAAGAPLWSQFFGGSRDEAVLFSVESPATAPTLGFVAVDHTGAVTVDANGNVIIVGSTLSADIPIEGDNPLDDEFNDDTGLIASGDEGDANVQNSTIATDYFVAKYDAGGNIDWSTYIGGANVDFATDVAVDGENNIYIVGGTYTLFWTGPGTAQLDGSFPTEGGYDDTPGSRYDVGMVKLRPDGALDWSSYFGGEDMDAYPYFDLMLGQPTDNAFLWWIMAGTQVRIDSDNNVCVIGQSDTDDETTIFPDAADQNRFDEATTPIISAAVYTARFLSGGGANSFVRGMRFDGGGMEILRGADVYEDGRIAVGGVTFSPDLLTQVAQQHGPIGTPYQSQPSNAAPDPNRADWDGFFGIVNAEDDSVMELSFLGNEPNDELWALDVTPEGFMHVCGFSNYDQTLGGAKRNVFPRTQDSFTFPEVVPPAPYMDQHEGTTDAPDGWLAKFDDPLDPVQAPCDGVSDGVPVNILAYTRGTNVAWEFNNTLAALDLYFDNYDLTTTDTDNAGALGALLAGVDVVIIPSIFDPSVAGDYTTIAPALQTFVDNGGTVIFTGTRDDNGQLAAVTNTGFFEGLTFTSGLATSDQDSLPITDYTTCLSNNLESPFIGPDSFYVYQLDTTLAGNDGTTVVSDIALVAPGNIRTGGVFLRRVGANGGKVILLGASYTTWNKDAARLLANAVSCEGDGQRYALYYEVTPAVCQGAGDEGAIDLDAANAMYPLTYEWSNGEDTQDIEGLAAGTYTVTVTGGPNGACTEILDIEVPGCRAAADDSVGCRPMEIEPLPETSAFCNPSDPVNIASNPVAGSCGDYIVEQIQPDLIQVPPDAVVLSEFDAGAGAASGILTEETVSGPYPLRFDFDFYCNTHRQLYISQDGFVSFDPNEDYLSLVLPEPAQELGTPGAADDPNNLIAINWVTLSPGQGGRITYFTEDTGPQPPRAVITWEDVPYTFRPNVGSDESFTGQLILYADGTIEMHVEDAPSSDGVLLGAPPNQVLFTYPKTMGLEGPDGDPFLVIDNRNRDVAWSAANEGWRLTPTYITSNLTYEWYNANDLTTVLSTDSVYAEPGGLTDTTVFVARVYNQANNCFYDEDTTLFVDEPSVGGDVFEVGAGATVIGVCPDINTGNMELVNNLGAVVRWEFEDPDNVGVWNPIANLDSTFGFVNVSKEFRYRAVVQNGACDEAPSAALEVDFVTPQVQEVASTEPTCFGSQDGSIEVGVAGEADLTGWTFRWVRNGILLADSDSLLENARAGTYEVVAINPDGCESDNAALITLEQPDDIFAVLDVRTDITCSGDADGEISITPSGGTGAGTYTFEWSNGADTEDLTGLTAGCYSLTIADGNMCVDSTSIRNVCIVEPDPLDVVVDKIDSVSCNGGGDGKIFIDVRGGFPPYIYEWSDSPTTLEDRSNLEAGTFTLTVRDQGGCAFDTTFTVEEPEELTINETQVDPVSCHGGDNGTVSLEVVGGNQPYVFNWSNGAKTEDIADLEADVYCITVTDRKGCQRNRCVEVGQPNPMRVIFTDQQAPSCAGEEDGRLEVGVTGGVPPYDYDWSEGANNSPVLNLVGQGVYCVNVTDANNCLARACIPIFDPAPLEIVLDDKVDINCNGENTGVINIDVTGGQEPYTYVWSGGLPAQEDQSELPSGTYAVTVTDDAGCQIIRSFDINEPDALELEIVLTRDLLCNGDNSGEIDINVTGGEIPYEFEWLQDGEPYSTDEDLFGIPAGNYVINITDKNGCTATDALEIAEPEPLAFEDARIEDVSCPGGADGVLAVDVTGGTPFNSNYVYEWTNGGNLEEINNLPAGDQCVTVTDNNGCEIDTCLTVNQPDPIVITLESRTNVSCLGGDDGEIDISVEGGTPEYVYNWNNGAVTEDLSGLTADGSPFEVEVEDANGCVEEASFVLTEPETAIELTLVSLQDISCNGRQDGRIDISVTGGTPRNSVQPYVYEWLRDGAGPFSIEQDISNLQAGDYCVTATDELGCEAEECFVIEEPELLQVTEVTSENVTCFGARDGSAEVFAEGGRQPYTYRWLHNNWLQPEIPNLGPGAYVVQVQDASNCSAFGFAFITQPQEIVATVSSKTDVDCFDGETGEIDITVSGGTVAADYQYQWSNGEATQDLTGLFAGVYSVTITDDNGCQKILNNIEIEEPNAPIVITLLNKRNVRCFGEQSGSISTSVSGGTAPYTFAWSSSDATQSISSLPADTYTLTVTDAEGCTAESIPYEVTEPDELVITEESITNAGCAGGSDGAISVEVSGGTLPYFYTWLPVNRNTSGLVGVPAGDYTLRVRDANGCFETYVGSVTEPEPIEIELVSKTDASCAGVADGMIEVSVTGGTEPYDLQWNDPLFSTTENVGALPAGSYTLEVRDANNCLGTITVEINENPPLVAEVVDFRNVRCNGDANGAIIVDVQGGEGPYDYNWSHDGSINFKSITNLPADCYSMTVTDDNGCEATIDQCITEPDEVTATITDTENVSCFGACDGKIAGEASGGTPPYNFVWSNGDEGQNVISELCPGTYILDVFDENNCVAEQVTAEIFEPEELVVAIDTREEISCAGEADGSITVDVTGGNPDYDYNWSNGASTDDINNLEAGEYCLTVTDERQCIIQQCYTFEEPEPLVVTLEVITDAQCQNDNSGGIDVSVTGGTPDYQYIWSNNQVTQDIQNVTPGLYCLTVIDANGCEKDTCFEIELIPEPSAEITSLDDFYCLSADPVELEATPAGGVFSGPGVTGTTFDPGAAGSGTHVVEYDLDINGCLFSGEKTVTVSGAPDNANIEFLGFPQGPPFCSNTTTAYVLSYTPIQNGVTAVFDGPGVSFNGSDYVFRPFVAGAGTQTIEATLNFAGVNCPTTITRDVEVGAPITAGVTADVGTVCLGESATLTATGGTTYTWAPTTGLSCEETGCAGIGATVTASPEFSRTYTVTAIDGGCQSSATIRVNVTQPAPITVTPSAPSRCPGAPATLVASSQANYDYSWAPATGLSATTGNTVVAEPSATTTYTVTGQSLAGCQATQTVTVTILESPVSASADQTTLCDGEVAQLTASTTESGSFTYSWAPAEGLSATTGATVTANPQETTTYTVTRSGTGDCLAATVTITVIDGTAEFVNLDPLYCTEDACVTLDAIPAGGTFSGTGVNGGVFCPTTAGEGEFDISYSGTVNGCEFSATTQVTVTEQLDVAISNIESFYCNLNRDILLVPSVTGSVITGPGMRTGNFFNPSVAGNGMITLTVTPPESAGCYGPTEVMVEVGALNSAIGNLDDTYCVSQSAVTIAPTPAGGTLIGPGTSNGNTFDPAAAGVGRHQILYFGNFAGCNYFVQRNVEVTQGITVGATSDAASCDACGDGEITAFASGGSRSFEYTIDGGATYQTSPTFSGLAPGPYTVCAKDRGGECEACRDITVGSLSANCNTPENISVGNVSTTSATVSWDAVSGAVEYLVTYRELPNGGAQNQVAANNSLTLNGLASGETYEVTVTTICAAGASEESNPRLFATLDESSSCGTTDFINVSPGQTFIILNWTVVPGATGYELSWQRTDIANQPELSRTITSGSVSATPLTGLTSCATYNVRIRTICGESVSAFSAPVSVSTSCPTVCPETTILTAIPQTTTSALVSWQQQNSPATGYVLSWRRADNITTNWTNINVSPNTTNSFLLQNLTPGARYEVRIRTRCGTDLSSWSATVSFVQTLARASADEAAQARLAVYPNPNNGDFAVSVETEAAHPARLEIADLSGKTVYATDVELTPGSNELPVSLKDVAAGAYVLRLTIGERSQFVKVIVH